jgi:hypothetical protein
MAIPQKNKARIEAFFMFLFCVDTAMAVPRRVRRCSYYPVKNPLASRKTANSQWTIVDGEFR